MNILFLTTHLNTGGITSYLMTLAKGLTEQGNNVHIIASGGNREEDFKACGVHVVNMDIRTKSELSPKLYRSLNKIGPYIRNHNIDVIHAQTRVTQVMGHQLMKKYNVPYVSTCHGYFKTRLFRRLFPCWGKKVIAISEPVRQHLTDDFKVSGDDVVLVRSGIDVDQFQPADNQLKKKIRHELNIADKTSIGIIARLSDVKGQDVLIDAFHLVVQEIDDVQLLLIGTGKFESVLREKVTTHQLNDKVYFMPVEAETQQYLNALDIFVMPSRQEGLGLSVMEAQASGLAVVASRVGGLPTLIENEQTGLLVEPENSNTLAEALKTLIKNDTQRNKIAEAARIHALKYYSDKDMIKNTREVYQKVINQ